MRAVVFEARVRRTRRGGGGEGGIRIIARERASRSEFWPLRTPRAWNNVDEE